jgi:ATP-binding cassette, subfamily B, bacterial HlyB/CyaB
MQTGLICFEAVAQIHQMSVDVRSIVREYALTDQEVLPEELIRIIRHREFRAKIKKLSSPDKLSQHYPLPAIGIHQDNSYFLLLKVNAATQKALCYLPEKKESQEYTFKEIESFSKQQWIILSPRAFNSQVKFGFEWFYREILKYKKVIAEVLLGSFFIQLFGLVTPLFTQVIIDKVIVHRSQSTLDVIAFAFVSVILFQFLLNLTRNYIFTHTANKIDAKLGAKLFKQLFALPYMYFEARKVGNIISRIRELESIRDFITNKSVSVLVDLFFSFVFVIMMFIYSPFLTWCVLGFVALITLMYVLVTPYFRKRLDDKFQMAAQYNSYLVEAVTGVQTVKSLAIEGGMQKRWEDYLGQYLSSSFKLSNLRNISNAIANVFQQLMTITVLYLGVKLVIDSQLTIGQLIAFNMFANQFTSPVLRLANLWNEFQQTLLAVDRLGDILNHPVEVQSDKAITLPQIKGSIRFENISFKYTVNGPTVVKDLSFQIEPSTTIGLVGKSGSGKSTVTKLIQRLYLPQEGAIYIDDIDTRHLNPMWLRYNIGVVLQDSYLFSGTIRENISLPRPDAQIELIIQAATLAGAHEFITKLPEGYDTMVGERGSTLSGGQKQRIAIARALITNPRIILLDEATSALDYESERIIRENLKTIRQGRTVLIIAHRLTTVEDCDLIMVMENGNVVEQGTHSQLLTQKGYYYSLYHQQKEEVATLGAR